MYRRVVLNPEFGLELQGDTVLAPLGMIGRDATNQADVGARNPGASSLKHGELMPENGILSRQQEAGSSHATEGPKDQKEP